MLGLLALAGEQTSIDLTEAETCPIVPWEYVEEKGPAGTWSGQTIQWSWRDYLAHLPEEFYHKLFGDRGIRRFRVR